MLMGHKAILFILCVYSKSFLSRNTGTTLHSEKNAQVVPHQKKWAYGDNIYHRDSITGSWLQEDSVHSNADGSMNGKHVHHDTKVNRVLISRDFAYWGGNGPKIPPELLKAEGYSEWWKGRPIRNHYSCSFITELISWLRSFGRSGCISLPGGWQK